MILDNLTKAAAIVHVTDRAASLLNHLHPTLFAIEVQTEAGLFVKQVIGLFVGGFLPLPDRTPYQALSPARQKAIPRLLITDSQINSVCRDYYTNEVFGMKDNAISLFDFHNLLTQSNKNSYIDSYLQRGVNATEVSVGLNNVLQGLDNKYSWFLG